MDFKNFGETPNEEGNNLKPMGSFSLGRQSSIFSFTFDELQNTVGEPGKDFGSMNIDELLKSVWMAEETIATAGNREEGLPVGNIQRQGSLTLPRTLSQKTINEIWGQMSTENGDGNLGTGEAGTSNFNIPQRQQTLGEVTLEEFLVRAGVVIEDDTQQNGGTMNTNGFYGGNINNSNNNGLGLSFQQPGFNNGLVLNQPPSLTLNGGGMPQQPLFPKQANLAFASSGTINAGSTRDVSMKNNLAPVGGMTRERADMIVLGASSGSELSPDVASNSNPLSSSMSPVPYMFNRGRKSNGGVEKVIERRQRRMIKNRESAARSRARKQAYTLELEAAVAKQKELNQELLKKLAELMELEKIQKLVDSGNQQESGHKRQCLRRTVTGPW